nr:TIGR01212 family radical SAM protein [Endozoicomonas sp.]
MAYFQSYSNTYGSPEDLKRYYDEALAHPGVIGLAVGTRPDCVPDPVLELLSDYQDQGYEVWLELGLQSSFDHTLEQINRGHSYDDYEDAVSRAKKYGLKLCTHLIVGLPGEEPEDSLVSFDRVTGLGVDAIKVHPLHIVKGTKMARKYRNGEVRELTMESYT